MLVEQITKQHTNEFAPKHDPLPTAAFNAEKQVTLCRNLAQTADTLVPRYAT